MMNETLPNNQETFESWQARDFILDEIDREPDQEERMIKLYEYLQLLGGYDEELKEE